MKSANLNIPRIGWVEVFIVGLLCLTAGAQEASVDETMNKLASQISGSVADVGKLQVKLTNSINDIGRDAAAAQAESENLAEHANEQDSPEIKSLRSSNADSCHSHFQHLMYVRGQLLDLNKAAEFILRGLNGEHLVQPVVEAQAGVAGRTPPTSDQLAAAKEMLKLVSDDTSVLTARLADDSKQLKEQISKNQDLADQSKKFLDGIADSQTLLGEAEKESAKDMLKRLVVEKRHLSKAAAIDSDLAKYGQIVNLIVQAQELVLGSAK